MIAALPEASTWETQCFVSAAVAGVTAIAVVSASISRRSAASSPLRRVLVTAAVALVFVTVLAFLFASVEPCAQGPA